MSRQATTSGLALEVRDASKQKMRKVEGVPLDATVGELVQSLLDEMQLPQADAEGRPLVYQALLNREARHLHASELVGDALQPNDSVILQPNIEAGRG
jgi:hypothetical protein